MANNNAPFGFSVAGTVNGPVNFSLAQRLIASNNGTAIFFGDAVVPVTGTATGYIKQATASTVALAGIFLGCQYFSTSQQKTIVSKYWPGSDATGDVLAFVCQDPNAQFLCQAGGSNLGKADIGQNCQLNVGTGNTTTGVSGMFIDTVGTTSTYPFIILDVPSGATDPDPTLAYNWLLVGFNNMILKAGITGIS
jgi:hypothetical protein